VFIVERGGFRLTRGFYVAFVILLLISGHFGAVWLTMHMHVGPSRKDGDQ
jgi:hypothetical protein